MAARKIKLSHPGNILREEFMEPVGLSAYALAKALDVPLPRVNDIVREKRSISPEMAVLLDFRQPVALTENAAKFFNFRRRFFSRQPLLRRQASCPPGSYPDIWSP